MRRSICLAALVAAIACGAGAAPALGAGFTLSVAPQSAAVAGQPMILQVTGTIPV